MKKKFSVILPIYKNEENLPYTIPYIIERLDLFERYDVEIIMISDASPDNSYSIMKKFQKKYPNIIKIGVLSRNFGQMACIHAGMDLATGDVIGVISADMQEPFELFADMLDAWEKGEKFVLGVRESREDHGIYSWGGKFFHWFVHRYISNQHPAGGCDFYLMDRSVMRDYLCIDRKYAGSQMNLFWNGYSFKTIPYVRKKREQGKTGYHFSTKIEIFRDVIFENSELPIKAVFGAATLLALAFIIFLIRSFGVNKENVGIELIASFMFLCSSILLYAMSILGRYILKIYELSKERPRYVMEEVIDEVNKSL